MKKDKKIVSSPVAELNRDYLMMEPVFDIHKLKLVNGGWPIPIVKIPGIDKILKDSIRIQAVRHGKVESVSKYMNIMLNGGLKVPHIHHKDEIVLLDKKVLKEYFHAIADNIENIKSFEDINVHVK